MPQTLPQVSEKELDAFKSLFKKRYPTSLSVESILDSDGDEALEVTLTFADNVKDEDLRWTNVSEGLEAIRQMIWERDGGSRYVHMRLRRKKELSGEL